MKSDLFDDFVVPSQVAFVKYRRLHGDFSGNPPPRKRSRYFWLLCIGFSPRHYTPFKHRKQSSPNETAEKVLMTAESPLKPFQHKTSWAVYTGHFPLSATRNAMLTKATKTSWKDALFTPECILKSRRLVYTSSRWVTRQVSSKEECVSPHIIYILSHRSRCTALHRKREDRRE